jgi:hypothetical protein
MNKEKLIKRLKNIKQNANLSPEELDKLAIRLLVEKELKASFVGLLDTEVDKALALYYKYIEENSFESLAERSTLIGVIYKEILKERIMQFIRKEGQEKDGAIPLAMTEKVMDLDAQILTDKDKLGMLKDKNNDSFVRTLEELKKKAITYYNEHAGETYVKCPNCLQLFRLLMKVDNLEPNKASFFKGTTLYNKPLLDLYHNKTLTLEKIAEIMGVHAKYIIFIYENIYLKELKNDN